MGGGIKSALKISMLTTVNYFQDEKTKCLEVLSKAFLSVQVDSFKW
jgi:hypothetical protein